MGCKIEENKTFLRIYGFEGEPGGRGRSSRASKNQNVAGIVSDPGVRVVDLVEVTT